MKTTPLISVVLPVYNVAPYVKEAIDSILNQTIQDFEILIIDDCSTDNTLEVVHSYNDDRIVIITKEKNKGLIDSLNIGFEQAKGKYIARMDGDDINKIDRFEKQLNVLENNPNIKVCGCWLQEFGSSNRTIKHKENHDEIVARLLISCSMSLCCAMLNREWAVAIKFDENKKHVEDYDFWSRVAWSGKFYNIQEVLYDYRIHENQVSTIHNTFQKLGDVHIKIYLLKKLDYNTSKYNDSHLEKMLYLKEHFTVEEFSLYLIFLKDIISLNKKHKVFDKSELKKVTDEIRNQLIFKIYFQDSGLGINKGWRKRALLKMSPHDILRIFILKFKEKIKVWSRKKQ
jgi:glycosyltransferase involved in cell wall biosynthesis